MNCLPETYINKLKEDGFKFIYCIFDKELNKIVITSRGLKLTRDECDKIAENPKVIDPERVFETKQILDIDNTFIINGRLFAPVIDEDNTYICIAREINTKQLMVGFSSPIDPNIIMKSIEKLIKTEKIEKIDSSIQISHWVITYSRETRKLDIEGPLGKPRKILQQICEIYNKDLSK